MLQSYDYGIAQAPELESHGGTTFCAVATVALMNQLDTCFTHKQVKILCIGDEFNHMQADLIYKTDHKTNHFFKRKSYCGTLVPG